MQSLVRNGIGLLLLVCDQDAQLLNRKIELQHRFAKHSLSMGCYKTEIQAGIGLALRLPCDQATMPNTTMAITTGLQDHFTKHSTFWVLWRCKHNARL